MRNEAVQNVSMYPPICLCILHQPKRPVSQKNKWLEADDEKT